MITPPPGTPRVPAPWTLTGNAYVVLLRLPEKAMNEERFLPERLRGLAAGRTSIVMFVDYATSDAGPYRELLYIPCRFRVHEGRYWSITRIYVSTWSSVVNGQENWGIPKEHADFEVSEAGGVDRIRVSRAGHAFADLAFEPAGFSLPATSGLVPASLRTLVQHRAGRAFFFAPTASCKVRLARLREARVDPQLFPDIAQGRVLFAAKLSDFELCFPVPRIEPAPFP